MSGKQGNSNSSNESSNGGWESIPTSKITESWGGMQNFTRSYGLKPDASGYNEARQIVNAFKQADFYGGKSNNSSSKK